MNDLETTANRKQGYSSEYALGLIFGKEGTLQRNELRMNASEMLTLREAAVLFRFPVVTWLYVVDV